MNFSANGSVPQLELLLIESYNMVSWRDPQGSEDPTGANQKSDHKGIIDVAQFRAPNM